MFDTNGNGKVDQVQATFNETLASSNATAPWTLTAVPGGGTLTGVGTSGSVATLTISEVSADTSVGSFKVALAASASGIRDAAGNQSSFGATAPTDQAAPVVLSINRHTSSPTNAASVQFDVAFSESITGVGSGDFQLVQSGGVSGASITSVSGSGSTYTVTVNTGSGSGSLGLNLVDDDSIQDAATNKLGGTGAGTGNFTGQAYAIDKTGPTVTGIQSFQSNGTTAGNGTLEAGDKLVITFSEPLLTAPAGLITVTEMRSNSTNVLLTITGITSNSDTGSSTYLAPSGTKTATYSGGSATLTSSNVITVTVGSTISGNGTTQASSGTLVFAPVSTLQDSLGNGATGTFSTASTFKLF
jgi:hypothetical protein